MSSSSVQINPLRRVIYREFEEPHEKDLININDIKKYCGDDRYIVQNGELIKYENLKK